MRVKYPSIIIGVVLAGSMILTGCGGESSPSGSITVLAQHHPWTTAIEPYIPEFEEETGIDVDLQSFSEEQARDKSLVTLQSRSSEFDVFMSLKSREGLLYAQSGFYEPLDEYVDDPELAPESYRFEDFQASPLEGERVEGQLVGLPIIVEGPVIFYRKDLFGEYDIAPPEDIFELVDAARQIQENTGGDVYGVAIRGLNTALPYTFGPFFHNMGIEWLAEDGSPNFDTPESAEAIDLYATLAREYGPPGVVSNSFTQSSALFAQGRAGMEIDSSNELQSVIDPESSSVIDDVGVMPIPPGPGGNHPTVLQWGISTSAFSENKDAAWEFMKWATSPEMQLNLAFDGIASPRVSTWEDSEFRETLDEPVKEEWADTLNFVQEEGNPEVAPPGEDQPRIREIVGNAIDNVILGETTAEEAAEEIQRELGNLSGSE